MISEAANSVEWQRNGFGGSRRCRVAARAIRRPGQAVGSDQLVITDLKKRIGERQTHIGNQVFIPA